MVTAVVPYVPTDSLRLLPRDVQRFEPRHALDGGIAGTELLVEVVRRSTRWLGPGGWLLLELGGDQAEPIGRCSIESGFRGLDVMTDEHGDAARSVGSMELANLAEIDLGRSGYVTTCPPATAAASADRAARRVSRTTSTSITACSGMPRAPLRSRSAWNNASNA